MFLTHNNKNDTLNWTHVELNYFTYLYSYLNSQTRRNEIFIYTCSCIHITKTLTRDYQIDRGSMDIPEVYSWYVLYWRGMHLFYQAIQNTINVPIKLVHSDDTFIVEHFASSVWIAMEKGKWQWIVINHILMGVFFNIS